MVDQEVREPSGDDVDRECCADVTMACLVTQP